MTKYFNNFYIRQNYITLHIPKTCNMNYSIELILLFSLLLLNLIALFILFKNKNTSNSSQVHQVLQESLEKQEQRIRTEFQESRSTLDDKFSHQQVQLIEQMKLFGNHQNQWFNAFQEQLSQQAQSQHDSLHKVRKVVKKSIESLQEDNHKQLDKMRVTVDEKLQKTLETRLGQSFQQVSKHLEAVQQGLGEMKMLANGVGDLKKVLSNVKTRGVMGEMLLGNILEQILTPDQYSLNVKTIPHSSAHVEFAIKFPGKENQEVWLPIDSKFPMDIYEHLMEAYDTGTPADIDKAQAMLVKTVMSMAKDIQEKYISPPHTTDFGVLFLPVEGLFAEVVRNPGVMHELQSKHRIMLAGPTNLAAFLNSLQLGFKTIAIEKRSSEVWNILSAVKTEFGKFGETLDKVQTKLSQASKSIDAVNVRSRAIQRNLRTVDELPVGETEENEMLDLL